jgi:hypothetical protein
VALSDRDGALADRRPGEKRLATPQPVQVKPFQALPIALEHQQRAIPVEAVNVGYRPPILVGDSKLVQFPVAQIGPELELEVQVPELVVCRRLTGLQLGLGMVELGNDLDMPRGRILGVRFAGKPRGAHREPKRPGRKRKAASHWVAPLCWGPRGSVGRFSRPSYERQVRTDYATYNVYEYRVGCKRFTVRVARRRKIDHRPRQRHTVEGGAGLFPMSNRTRPSNGSWSP